MKACITLTLDIHGSLSSGLSLCSEEVGSASQNLGIIKKITIWKCDLWTENNELSKKTVFNKINKDDEKSTDVYSLRQLFSYSL